MVGLGGGGRRAAGSRACTQRGELAASVHVQLTLGSTLAPATRPSPVVVGGAQSVDGEKREPIGGAAVRDARLPEGESKLQNATLASGSKCRGM
jgi:hypothetical protein